MRCLTGALGGGSCMSKTRLQATPVSSQEQCSEMEYTSEHKSCLLSVHAVLTLTRLSLRTARSDTVTVTDGTRRK